MRTVLCHGLIYVAMNWVASSSVLAQWVAFNDYAPGVGTHPNATMYDAPGSGPLKDITTGAAVGATVNITMASTVGGTVQGVPDYGTPASVVFDGYVNFGGKPNPGIELAASTSSTLTITFSGLDPASEYNFQGTAVRGDIGHQNRWSTFEIVGANSFTSRHSPGALTTVQVPAITASQVAIQTGFNIQGLLAGWDHIRPSPGGTFSVTSRQYTGTVPNGTSNGSKGYGITGFRLEKAGVYSGRTNLLARLTNTIPHSINGIKTVFLILMENHDWNTILGSSFCPYLNNSLLPMSSYCDRYHSPIGNHPSEPNYLWLITGTNFGIRDDSAPSVNHQSSTKTLFQQLDAAGISWKCYAEDITGTTCPDADSGEYGVRHNPFVFFDSVRNNLNYCTNHIRPYPELARDLTNNVVPRFNFIVPNVTNDMHDTTPGSPSTRLQGDNWLSHEAPHILNSSAYTNGGALFITFDEGSTETDGPIAMLALSARAKGGGYHNNLFYTHSSMLRTLQNIFGVRPYLGDAAFASDLSDLFKTLRITSFRYLTNSFQITVTNVIAGTTNYVQGSPNILPGNWSNVATNVATSNSVSMTATVLSNSIRFYRIVEVP